MKLRGSASLAEAVLRQLMPALYEFGLPKETQLLSVVHHAEAAGFKDGGIHDILQRFLVVTAFHHDGLFQLNHSAPPGPNP